MLYAHHTETNTVRFLLASDTQYVLCVGGPDSSIGYLERDPVRGQDALHTFRELLRIAKDQQVRATHLTRRWTLFSSVAICSMTTSLRGLPCLRPCRCCVNTRLATILCPWSYSVIRTTTNAKMYRSQASTTMTPI